MSLNRVVFSFKIYFFFSFCSDSNLEATVVKTDKIRGLNNCLPSIFFNWEKKKSKIIINNYHIVHQKNHRKDNND